MTWGRIRGREPVGLLLLSLMLPLMLILIAMTSGEVVSAAEQPRATVDEFVPLDQVPPEDQLPAAPLLIAAYSLVWLFIFAYLWSIWRRMGTVERELAELTRRVENR